MELSALDGLMSVSTSDALRCLTHFPLRGTAGKVVAALAAGCTVILKPSEYSALPAIELAEICRQYLPKGVFNLVTGVGSITGQPLASHPNIDKVTFTGSFATGGAIMRAAASHTTDIGLELGGKSAAIVLPDYFANASGAIDWNDAECKQKLQTLIEWLMIGVFFNGGQVCSATSRLLVHRSISERVTKAMVTAAKSIKLGDPCHPELQKQTGHMGPLVCAAQLQKILGMLADAKQQGVEVLCGGDAVRITPGSIEQSSVASGGAGCFLQPTILRAKPHHRIAQQEVFGPVLCVLDFETEEEALKIANDSEYGLAGAVFTSSIDKQKWFTRRLRCGIVWVNCSQPTFCSLPWGGLKKSGVGRDLGVHGLLAYRSPKQIVAPVDATKPAGWYQLPSAL